MPQAKLCSYVRETVLKLRLMHGVASSARDGKRVGHAHTAGYLLGLRAHFSGRRTLTRTTGEASARYGLVTRATSQAG